MLLKFVAFQLFVIGAILCYTAILERTENAIVNKKYFPRANVYVKRYGRRSPYYLNIEGTSKYTLGNNITVVIEFKEKLSNMYKPTFVNFSFQLCNLISNDYIFGTMLRNVGIICPVPPGEYKFLNMTVAIADFPNVIPFTQGRAEMSGIITATKEVIYTGYIYFTLIRDKPRMTQPTNKTSA